MNDAQLEPVTAFLALGSNMGDRLAHIQSAIWSLQHAPSIQLISQSDIIETEPVGLANQEKYLNAALKIETTLSPSQLLQTCLSIEQSHGRVRSPDLRWGSRSLDIDVLMYGDRIVDEPGPPRLQLPHPHLHNRLFVLEPLAQIAPELVHPILKKSVQMLLLECRARTMRQIQE